METISAVNSHDEDSAYFDPESYDDSGILKCCCGYELIKEDEDTYRCTGGSHRYRVSKEECFLGRDGQMMFKKPSEHNGDKDGGKKEDE